MISEERVIKLKHMHINYITGVLENVSIVYTVFRLILYSHFNDSVTQFFIALSRFYQTV